MDLDPVFLSRIQFAFVVSFHIIFPAFTVGLAAWLATIEAAHLVTGKEIYRRSPRVYLFVPVIVAYTLGVYWLFRGEVRVGYG